MKNEFNTNLSQLMILNTTKIQTASNATKYGECYLLVKAKNRVVWLEQIHVVLAKNHLLPQVLLLYALLHLHSVYQIH